jgi:hypothetical protein
MCRPPPLRYGSGMSLPIPVSFSSWRRKVGPHSSWISLLNGSGMTSMFEQLNLRYWYVSPSAVHKGQSGSGNALMTEGVSRSMSGKTAWGNGSAVR